MPPKGDSFLDTAGMKLRVGRREVNVSNPDKIFFPKRRLRKIDLVEYYLDVADCVLNHVQRRPMQMKRYPDGAEEWFFYQKRVPANHPDWLETVHIKFPSGRTADFPVSNEPQPSPGSSTSAASTCTPGTRASTTSTGRTTS